MIIMRRLIYFVLAFIVWIFLTWPFVNGKIDMQLIIAGVVASGIVAFLFHEILPKEHHVFISPKRIFWFIVYEEPMRHFKLHGYHLCHTRKASAQTQSTDATRAI